MEERSVSFGKHYSFPVTPHGCCGGCGGRHNKCSKMHLALRNMHDEMQHGGPIGPQNTAAVAAPGDQINASYYCSKCLSIVLSIMSHNLARPHLKHEHLTPGAATAAC